ncbi:MAG: hypothetical protein ACO1SV_21845 [Fimbriimonas sp.]
MAEFPRIRLKLRDQAESCAREECIVHIGGDGVPYFTHLAFDIEDASGRVIGTLALKEGSSLCIPLSKMVWRPREDRNG